MQAHIYWTKAALLTPRQIQKELQCVPPEKQQRIQGMKSEQRISTALAAERLLRYGIKQLCQIVPPIEQRAVTPQGKPYYKDVPLHFSLSHSGEYALAAVAEANIGADIQVLRPAKYEALAKRMYTQKECDLLQTAQDMQQLFYRIWVCKESLGKYLGSGIHVGLPAVMETGAPAPGFFCESLSEVCIGGYTQPPVQWNVQYIELINEEIFV